MVVLCIASYVTVFGGGSGFQQGIGLFEGALGKIVVMVPQYFKNLLSLFVGGLAEGEKFVKFGLGGQHLSTIIIILIHIYI